MNLKQILSRTGDTITAQRAGRLNKVGLRSSDNYVEDLEVERDNILDKIEDNLDISANVDHNAGQCKITNADMTKIIIENHKLREELHLITQRLEVAKTVNAEYKAEEDEK